MKMSRRRERGARGARGKGRSRRERGRRRRKERRKEKETTVQYISGQIKMQEPKTNSSQETCPHS